MLDITKKTISLEPQEVMELERIMVDEDSAAALEFLKKHIYQPLSRSQENRLKSHLNGYSDPAGSFKKSK